MFGGHRFKAEACEIQCKLCLGRIKMQRNKRTIQLQLTRKDVAQQLQTGRQDYARIRVEGVIREQQVLEAYAVLELYVELLSIRVKLVAGSKEIPRDMVEAISSIIYAAQRIGDLPELQKMRKMFESKYGQQYVQEAGADATTAKWQVNPNLIRCLLVEPPEAELKLQTLSDIAQEHQVEWDAATAYREMLPAGGGTAVPVAPGAVAAASYAAAADDDAPPASLATGSSMSTGGGTPHFGVPHGWPAGAAAPPPPGTVSPNGGQYANAGQAASAAAYAAAQAKAAADYAAHFAFAQAGVAFPGGAPSGSGAAAQSAPPAAPPGAAGSAGGWLATPGVPPAAAPAPATPQEGVPGYATRPVEEIQRAYDQALGPPAKEATAPAVAPLPGRHDAPSSAPAALPPPAPPTPPANGMPAAPIRQANSGGLSLPAPPSGNVQPGAPPPAEDEYAALARRLADLKRG